MNEGNGFKPTLLSVATVVLQTDDRLARWIFDERSEASINDRATNVVFLEALKSEVIHDQYKAWNYDTLKLLRKCQGAVANALPEIDTSQFPTREGKLVFTDRVSLDGPHRTEISRHSDHVLVPEQVEVAEHVTADRKQFCPIMCSLLQRHQKSLPAGAAPVVSERLQAEWDRVGNKGFNFLANLRSQVGRLHLNSKGEGSYQNSKWIRPTIIDDYATECDAANLAEFERDLQKLGFNQALVDEVNAAPIFFMEKLLWGKKTPLYISYCMAHADIKATGKTRRRAYIDGVVSMQTFMAKNVGDEICMKLMGKTVNQLVNMNAVGYEHFRETVFNAWRNSSVHGAYLNQISYETFDDEVGKTITTQGGYGAKGPAVGLSLCGLKKTDVLEEVEVEDLLQFVAQIGAKKAEIPDCLARFVSSTDSKERLQSMQNVAGDLLSIMLRKQAHMQIFLTACGAVWDRDVAAGNGPPTIVSALGYNVNVRQYRRNINEWTRVKKEKLTGFDLDRTVQVNKYELVELGTPLPPLTVHTDEASWQDMCILLAKEQGWCPNPVFDGDGVPIGKLIQAKKNAVESFNFHSAFDSPFEQWGLPRRKSIPRLPEDADILAIE